MQLLYAASQPWDVVEQKLHPFPAEEMWLRLSVLDQSRIT